MPIFTRDLPDYGDLMTVEEFDECCEDGSFIDYDGFGHPSDGTMMDPTINVYPSNRAVTLVGATHIMWFNR